MLVTFPTPSVMAHGKVAATLGISFVTAVGSLGCVGPSTLPDWAAAAFVALAGRVAKPRLSARSTHKLGLGPMRGEAG
ncbi:hypothetical protein CIC12_15800, partial [Burkholderia sp. SG-MS1]|uniref:hypothetical protein n=1 Tax=Paraburkholderia sp. SG-MS1 TaxID=2023741 RepID=UPI0014486D61